MTEVQALVDLPVQSKLPPPSEHRIRRFENACRIRLPQDFLEFFCRYHGAVLDDVVFTQGRRERLIERILTLIDRDDLEENGTYDIGYLFTQIGERLTDNPDQVGERIIPFAALFAGDFVCLDFEHSDLPSVVVWDHEQSDDFQPVLIKVADTFREFEELIHHAEP